MDRIQLLQRERDTGYSEGNGAAALKAIPGTSMNGAAPDLLPQLLQTEQKIRDLKSQPILRKPPLLTLKEKGVIWPNTINILQGQKGAGKSHSAAGFVQEIIRKPEVASTFGIKRFSDEAMWGAYIDTERNQAEQFPAAVQSLQALAGYPIEEHPENFHYTSLLEIPRELRYPAMRQYLQHLRTMWAGPLFVVLDVATDFIQNPNDLAQTLEFSDYLNVCINQLNVTFLVVIHENLGLGHQKATGHIGTELTRKASGVFQASEDRERGLFALEFMHIRDGGRPAKLWLEYSEENKCLVPTEEANIPVEHEKRGKAKVDPADPVLQQKHRAVLKRLRLNPPSTSEDAWRFVKSQWANEGYAFSDADAKAFAAWYRSVGALTSNGYGKGYTVTAVLGSPED